MTSGVRVVDTNALPPNTVKPLEPGTNNVFNSAIASQNNANQMQNSLGKAGGKRKRKKSRKTKKYFGGTLKHLHMRQVKVMSIQTFPI
jgi:hypothetical protein